MTDPLSREAILAELETVRRDLATHKKAYRTALDDRERWKRMWETERARVNAALAMCDSPCSSVYVGGVVLVDELRRALTGIGDFVV